MHAPAASPHSAEAIRAAAVAATAASASSASPAPSTLLTRAHSQSGTPKMQLASASHFTAAMMDDDGEARSDSATAPVGHAARSKWAALPSDLVRLVLSFTTNARSVWSASHVCTNWRSSVDHHTVWAALCSSAGWIVPAGLPRPFVRAFFVDRYRTVRHYSRAYWSRKCSWVAHAAGILHLAVPPPKVHYSWSSGRTERVDEGLIISAASAPTYGLKVWRTSGPGLSLTGSSSSSSAKGASSNTFQPECLNEQHVYGNPLLLHAANGSNGNDGGSAGGNSNASSSALRSHPLDPVSSNLKTHWSCVDIYTTGSLNDGGGASNAAAMANAMQSGSWEAQQMYAAQASSAGSADFSSAGGNTGSSLSGPPTRSSNFLLFAGMHRPLLYLFDLHAKRMRAFKPGHTSAICCVKMGRDLAADAAPAAMQPFGSTYAAAAPRRRLAVSGGYNDEVCVWDVDLGTLVARLRGGGETAEHPQPPTAWCVDIHARGRLVAAGSNSGVIRIYKLDLAHGEVDEEEAAREAAMTKEEKTRRDREKKMEAMRALLSANTEDDDEQQADSDNDAAQAAAMAKRNPWESLPPFVAVVAPPVAAAPAAGAGEDGAEGAAAPAAAAPAPAPVPVAAPAAAASSASSSSGPSPGGPAPVPAAAAPVVPPAAPVDPLQNLTAGAVLLLTLEGHTKSPMTVQFDPFAPSSILWSAGYDKTIRQWDIDPRNAVDSVDPPPVRGARAVSRDDVAESKDASDDDLVPSDRPLVRRGVCLRVFLGHTAVIFSLVVTPHVVISSSRDGCVRIWDRDSGASLRELECNVTSSDLVSEIQGANVSSEQGASLSSSRSQSRDIKCLSLTSDGAIVTASSDGRIQMFEFETRASRELKLSRKQQMQAAGKHDPKGNNSNRAGVQSSMTRSLSGGGGPHGGAGGGDRDATSPDEPSCVVM